MNISWSKVLKSLGVTHQNLLAFECRCYNRLSDADKRSPAGRRIYANMKRLNERILAHD